MHFALLLASLAAAAPNLVYNGDLELDSPASPPPGFAMWGAERWKTPANFTRDTTVAHSGRASLKIVHPAGTAGYLVTDPRHALRPEAGQVYTVSLWAKADAPGQARCGVTAYASLNPFVDAPAPGGLTLEVGPAWRQYRFTLTEGLDFFAARSRYLLLALFATTTPAEARTLWVDDLEVTAAPNPDPVRLVDEATLPVPPLDHRLTPGERLDVTVDASRVLHPTPRAVGGVSFHRLVGWTGQPFDRAGAKTLDPRLESAIRDLRLPMTRFYGVGHEPFAIEAALDKTAALCRSLELPLDRVVLELEEQSANRSLPPADWARAVRYARAQGYGFRYWELGNEVYSQNFHDTRPMGQAFRGPADYVAHVQAVAAAIRAEQPDAQIGLSLEPRNLMWGNWVLRKAAGSYDFLCPHFYAFANLSKRSFESVALGENYRQLERPGRLLALARLYNPGREIIIHDTEWGLHGGDDQGSRADDVNRNANIWGVLHRAVRLIYYARENLVHGASGWQMLSAVRSPGFGILSQQAPDQRFALYWLYRWFNTSLLDQVVAVNGSAPWYTAGSGAEGSGPLTPLLATRSTDGRRLTLMVANGSWSRSVPARVRLAGFVPARVAAVVLSQDGQDAPALLPLGDELSRPLAVTRDGDTLTWTLPPHAVAFVQVAAD